MADGKQANGIRACMNANKHPRPINRERENKKLTMKATKSNAIGFTTLGMKEKIKPLVCIRTSKSLPAQYSTGKAKIKDSFKGS
jgi:hypothetical protein